MRAKLIQAAWAAREAAYAPYSGYAVGAALGTDEGQIITGCNVENASYGLSCCAERVAVFQAVSQQITEWSMLVLATEDQRLPYPCGACRQVLWEFSRDLVIVSVNRKEERHTNLRQLLPYGFDLDAQNTAGQKAIAADLRQDLLAAGRSGQKNDVLELLRAHPELARAADPLSGISPLHQAARHGHVTVVRQLIKLGADVNLANRWGLTPLHYAVRAGQQPVVDLLLQYGANPEAQDNRGLKPTDLV